MLLSQAKATFGEKQAFYVKLSMFVQAADSKANLRAQFCHKQSFWWKQVCLSENEHNACHRRLFKDNSRRKQAYCNENKYV